MRRIAKLALLGLVLASATASAADCVKLADVCVEGPATRTVAGTPVYRDCWRTRATYSCLAPQTTDDCQPLRDRGCSQLNANCIATDAQGLCTTFEQTWQCTLAPASSNTVTNCGSRRFCLDGSCFDTSHAPDADFARAVAGLEMQREASRYADPATLEVFKGYDNRCHKKLFGLVNCCAGGGSSGALLSTMSLIAGAGGQAFGAVGSSYTYDALFTSDAPDLVIAGFESLFGAGGGSSALAGLIAGDVSVSAFMTTLVPGPWTVAMLAIQFSGLLSCEAPEQVLAMKKDRSLCHAVGSYCSRKVPIFGTCLETTQSYCCFNSRLSRILNEQGRAQLGRGWGNAQRPDCAGLSLTQLQSLDFSKIDLSEFYAEIVPTLPDPGVLGQKARSRVQGTLLP